MEKSYMLLFCKKGNTKDYLGTTLKLTRITTNKISEKTILEED